MTHKVIVDLSSVQNISSVWIWRITDCPTIEDELNMGIHTLTQRVALKMGRQLANTLKLDPWNNVDLVIKRS